MKLRIKVLVLCTILQIRIQGCYSEDQLRSNYILTPLAHGYYFSDHPPVSWEAARQNCMLYNLELASILNKQDYEEMRDAFLIHPIWDNFIGAAQGLFISAVGTDPWDHEGFAWEIQGKNYSLSNYEISSSLWAPTQPDNADPLEQCTVLYLQSADNVKLVMADVQCGWKRGFLCQRPTSPEEGRRVREQHTVKKLDDGSFIGEGTWARAVQECARVNASQIILSTQSAVEDFIAKYYNTGILGHSEAVWTSASSLGELSEEDLKQMPYGGKFRWPDHRYHEDIPHPTEQCLAFSVALGLFEQNCLTKLSFICKEPVSSKCHTINFETIKVDKRIFYYSNHNLMNWDDAVMCCASRQQRLLSVATPIVGNLLSYYLQTNKQTVGRHTGFKYGIWTSGNLLNQENHNSTYEFASSYERIQLEYNGVNHYQQGPAVFQGECLQFVIDDGLVHTYVLNNISCALYRSFICEEAERLVTIQHTTWVAHPEDKSVVYVNSTATWQEAFQACDLAKMTLLTIESEEENKKALQLLEAAKLPGEDPWMIWLGATRLIGINVHPDFIWLSLNRTVTYSNWVYGKPDNYYPHEWCANGAAKGGEFVWDDIDCQQKMRFMCRITKGWKTDGK